MKNGKSIAFVLMLLLSAGVLAEGGKQRGDEGQGSIVQDQVRVVEPPAQWTATSTLSGAVQTASDEAEETEMDEQAESLF
jgi:hypothetical protein